MTGRRPVFVALVAAMLVAGLATPAAATASLSIAGVSLPDSVTQGDSFELTVSVSGEEVENDAVDVSLTLPDGLSCSPSGTQQVTLSDGTGEATFDCSADVEGDYAGEITVSAAATDSNDGSSLSRSTQTGLEVLSPASLTLSTSLDDESIDVDDSTSLTVVVHNAGDSSTSYDLSLASSSGYSASVTAGSTTGTIGGGDTVSVEYSLTGDEDGTHALDPTVSGGNGQTVAESLSIDVAGSSGDGGSDTPTPTPTETTTPTPTPTASETPTPAGTETTATPTTPTSTPMATSTVAETATATSEETVTATSEETVTSTAERTATATSEETPTSAETATPTETEAGVTTPTDADGPGFGPVAAALALLAAALLAARRR